MSTKLTLLICPCQKKEKSTPREEKSKKKRNLKMFTTLEGGFVHIHWSKVNYHSSGKVNESDSRKHSRNLEESVRIRITYRTRKEEVLYGSYAVE